MVKCSNCTNLRLVIEVMKYQPFDIKIEPSMKNIDGGEVCGHHYECGEGHSVSERCQDCDKERECSDFEEVIK